jgi:hypothetical protein
VPKITNIWDLVERATARGGIPRLEFWQKVTKALLLGELPALNLSEQIHPKIAVTTYREWLIGLSAAVGRFNDPQVGARFLKRIMVRESDFQSWRRTAAAGRRGPRQGTTGYAKEDRKLFPRIKKLIATGSATSARAAALQLFDEGKVNGNSRDSAAKRVAGRYLKEHIA